MASSTPLLVLFVAFALVPLAAAGGCSYNLAPWGAQNCPVGTRDDVITSQRDCETAAAAFGVNRRRSSGVILENKAMYPKGCYFHKGGFGDFLYNAHSSGSVVSAMQSLVCSNISTHWTVQNATFCSPSGTTGEHDLDSCKAKCTSTTDCKAAQFYTNPNWVSDQVSGSRHGCRLCGWSGPGQGFVAYTTSSSANGYDVYTLANGSSNGSSSSGSSGAKICSYSNPAIVTRRRRYSYSYSDLRRRSSLQCASTGFHLHLPWQAHRR
jgi:hypothetical protein